MDRLKYRQCIQIGKNVTSIMKLPCVRVCEKTSLPGVMRYGFYPLRMVHPNPYQKGETGDWLCENEFGKWDIVKNEVFKKEVGYGKDC